jgi:hypothetical protein
MSAALAMDRAMVARQAAETLALALWAAVGRRPVRAIEALASLVVNRAKLAAAEPAARLRFAPGAPAEAAFWPLLLGPVCRAPFLFGRRQAGRDAPVGDPALAICSRIAARAAADSLPDATEGATHWHDAGELPGWALGQVPVAETGGLVLYRLPGEPAARPQRRAEACAT